jgi:hypothetical protein
MKTKGMHFTSYRLFIFCIRLIGDWLVLDEWLTELSSIGFGWLILDIGKMQACRNTDPRGPWHKPSLALSSDSIPSSMWSKWPSEGDWWSQCPVFVLTVSTIVWSLMRYSAFPCSFPQGTFTLVHGVTLNIIYSSSGEVHFLHELCYKLASLTAFNNINFITKVVHLLSSSDCSCRLLINNYNFRFLWSLVAVLQLTCYHIVNCRLG